MNRIIIGCILLPISAIGYLIEPEAEMNDGYPVLLSQIGLSGSPDQSRTFRTDSVGELSCFMPISRPDMDKAEDMPIDEPDFSKVVPMPNSEDNSSSFLPEEKPESMKFRIEGLIDSLYQEVP